MRGVGNATGVASRSEPARSALGSTLALALWVVFGASAAHAIEPLEVRLERAVGAAALRGARIAVLVVDRDAGGELFARHPDRAQIPASNMKVLTAVAALSMFGPTHRFETGLFADSMPGPDGSIGRLGVRGGGDPALTSERFWRLAADLRLRGIRRIERGLVLDATAFDAERWHPSWGVVSSRAYNAPVSALSANYGSYAVSVMAGAKPGDAVGVVVDPPVTHLRAVNEVATVGSRAKAKLVIDRREGSAGERVVVSGSVRAGAEPDVHYRSVADPVRYAGALLRLQLAANGIEVGDEIQVGPIDPTWPALPPHEGRPLSEVVGLLLKYSNNSIAETLVKAMGARHSGGVGSWANGSAAVRAELTKLGIDLDGQVLVDGSGLSYENRVTARALVAALRVAHDSFRFGPELRAGLPIAAADGTLKKRAGGAEHRVRAKTGLLTRVTSLAGYAETRTGQRLIFSILVQGFRSSASSAMAAVDAFAAELVR